MASRMPPPGAYSGGETQGRELMRTYHSRSQFRGDWTRSITSLAMLLARPAAAADESVPNFIVIFCDDMGTNFEGGLRVPCLMRWPGRIAKSRRQTTCCPLSPDSAAHRYGS